MTRNIMHGSLSCQLTAVRPLPSLGDAISETAQPYQSDANRCSSTTTESGSPARNVSSKKKHRTCLTHMPSQWIRGRQGKPTADGHYPTKVVYLWAREERSYPTPAGGHVRDHG